MTERPDEPSFASPGPAVPAGTGPVPAPITGGPDGARVVPDVVAHPDPAVHGGRWGAPGGPTAAERAAARRRARWWVAGVLTAVVLVVGVAAGVSWLVSSARERAWEPVSADVTAPARVNAVQLVLGSCLATVPESSPVTTVDVVPCDDEHRAQVVGRTDSAPEAVWPGEDVLARTAARSCTADLLGPQARGTVPADLTFSVWTPTAESWADGDRAGLCLAASATPLPGDLLE
jgi:hypothetical protein